MRVIVNVDDLTDSMFAIRAVERAIESRQDSMCLGFGHEPHKIVAHAWRTKSGWSSRVDISVDK